jgi:hypothetical protein
MWKAITVGTAAVAIASTSIVYAQQAGRADGEQRWQTRTEGAASTRSQGPEHQRDRLDPPSNFLRASGAKRVSPAATAFSYQRRASA